MKAAALATVARIGPASLCRGRLLQPSLAGASLVSARQLGRKSALFPRLVERSDQASTSYRVLTMATAAVDAPSSNSLRTYTIQDLNTRDRTALMARPRIDFAAIFDQVRPIVESVRERGDAAVLEYTERFDGVVPEKLVEKMEDIPWPKLDEEVAAAFDVAFENIKAFHQAQLKTMPLEVETMKARCEVSPGFKADRVCWFVCAGWHSCPAFNSADAGCGCKTIVLATPPRRDGSIAPEVLYVAKKAGVTHILKAGGAQAVAAMAYGTRQCPKVDKILGPGNQYVTAAKMLLQNSEAMISIDMPAGPSEVLVIADEGADPAHVAADLLSQAEHGPDSQVVLVTLPGVDLPGISRQVASQCEALPRADIALQALSHSYVVQAANRDEACKFSNQYAPEHLIVNVENAEDWLPQLDNAGSIFLGRWTPESVGDYASGTNHVLPTYGYARMYGGVSLDSFMKYMTVQELTHEGLQKLGPSVAKMAEVEGLDAHRRAVTLRLGIVEL
eukprot:jgi/Chlat1/6206/Chrsp44S00448